jgi:hypothetical protein
MVLDICSTLTGSRDSDGVRYLFGHNEFLEIASQLLSLSIGAAFAVLFAVDSVICGDTETCQF